MSNYPYFNPYIKRCAAEIEFTNFKMEMWYRRIWLIEGYDWRYLVNPWR